MTRTRPTKRFIVRYTDENDSGCPVMEWRCFAYDFEHAREKFIESDFDEFGDWTGWNVLSVDRPRDASGKVITRFDREAA